MPRSSDIAACVCALIKPGMRIFPEASYRLRGKNREATSAAVPTARIFPSLTAIAPGSKTVNFSSIVSTIPPERTRSAAARWAPAAAPAAEGRREEDAEAGSGGRTLLRIDWPLRTSCRNSNGSGRSSWSLKRFDLPSSVEETTSMSPANSQRICRQAPQGGVGSSAPVTTATARNRRTPSESAFQMATRSAQTVRP